jgi:NAD(P)-dependent dehydrogenase (short-subunit alcohol dehydrogenase family)
MGLGESGVRVNCIWPGAIATPTFGRGFGLSVEDAEKTIGILEKFLADNQPIRRSGIPDDIAHAALWLASDDSGFVNGHALVVDGASIGGKMWSDSDNRWSQLKSAMVKHIKTVDSSEKRKT